MIHTKLNTKRGIPVRSILVIAFVFAVMHYVHDAVEREFTWVRGCSSYECDQEGDIHLIPVASDFVKGSPRVSTTNPLLNHSDVPSTMMSSFESFLLAHKNHNSTSPLYGFPELCDQVWQSATRFGALNVVLSCASYCGNGEAHLAGGALALWSDAHGYNPRWLLEIVASQSRAVAPAANTVGLLHSTLWSFLPKVPKDQFWRMVVHELCPFENVKTSHFWECLHGVGHGALRHAAARTPNSTLAPLLTGKCIEVGVVNGDQDHVLEIHARGLDICHSAPNHQMSLGCAFGLYHGMLEHYQLPFPQACQSSRYPSPCFFWFGIFSGTVPGFYVSLTAQDCLQYEFPEALKRACIFGAAGIGSMPFDQQCGGLARDLDVQNADYEAVLWSRTKSCIAGSMYGGPSYGVDQLGKYHTFLGNFLWYTVGIHVRTLSFCDFRAMSSWTIAKKEAASKLCVQTAWFRRQLTTNWSTLEIFPALIIDSI